jgi:hypothetical protein
MGAVALLVLLPMMFLYLSHVLSRGEDDNESASIYQPWILLEDYDFDALADASGRF